MEEAMSKQTLEQRITAALGDDKVSADNLEQLLVEAEDGIAKADKESTIDQTLSLDPKAARQAIEDATFAANRLRMLLSKLHARHHQLCEQARVEEWEAKAQVLDEESIQLAEELREAYPTAENKVIDLFARIAAHRQRISALHQCRPPGVESVRDPELIARNLDGFDRERPTLLAEVHLLDLDSGRQAWPPPQPSIASAFAAMAMPYDRYFTADWAKDNERRVAARRAEQQRMADYYARLTQEQEERENAEARESFVASQYKIQKGAI
jgi:hypothetical protein